MNPTPPTVPTARYTIDGLKRPYRQGLILARADYSDTVNPLTLNTVHPELLFCHLKGVTIAARNTAIGMLQNGYDLVSVIADKSLNVDGTLPYSTTKSFFGRKPTCLTPAEEAEEVCRAQFARNAIASGRLLWFIDTTLSRSSIVKCINSTASATPTVNGEAKGPASTNSELTVYLVGHGFRGDGERSPLTLAYGITLGVQDNHVRIFGGYTVSQLLQDLTLAARWHHLLIMVDACNAGEALSLTNDYYVPSKAETFIDAPWHYAYHCPTYQFIGSALNDTDGQSAEYWQGTLFSMAMQEVLWATNATAFAGTSSMGPCNWATVSRVAEKLQERINTLWTTMFGNLPISRPTCLSGRLDLAKYSVNSCNSGQFLFIHPCAPSLWPYQEISLPPIPALYPMAPATSLNVTYNNMHVAYSLVSDPAWTHQIDFGPYDPSRFAAIVTPPSNRSPADTLALVKARLFLRTPLHFHSDYDLQWTISGLLYNITFTLLTTIASADGPHLFVLLAVCSGSDYQAAIQCVTKEYKPGLVLAFAATPNSTSESVMVSSSFVPNTLQMPPGLSDNAKSLLTQTRFTISVPTPSLKDLSVQLCCEAVPEADPGSTSPLASMWHTFSFLKHSHDSDFAMGFIFSRFFRLLNPPTKCSSCDIIPVCVLIPSPSDVIFADDITVAGLFAAAPLFTSPMSVPYIPTKLVKFEIHIAANTVDVQHMLKVLNDITRKTFGHGGGFLYHIGNRSGSIIVDLIGSLAYVWALRVHVARNDQMLDGMKVKNIQVLDSVGGLLSDVASSSDSAHTNAFMDTTCAPPAVDPHVQTPSRPSSPLNLDLSSGFKQARPPRFAKQSTTQTSPSRAAWTEVDSPPSVSPFSFSHPMIGVPFTYYFTDSAESFLKPLNLDTSELMSLLRTINTAYTPQQRQWAFSAFLLIASAIDVPLPAFLRLSPEELLGQFAQYIPVDSYGVNVEIILHLFTLVDKLVQLPQFVFSGEFKCYPIIRGSYPYITVAVRHQKRSSGFFKVVLDFGCVMIDWISFRTSPARSESPIAKRICMGPRPTPM